MSAILVGPGFQPAAELLLGAVANPRQGARP
jgi:hypothetical protein